jgi:[ribosomal protein S18]-alanine N-acetyltransferase
VDFVIERLRAGADLDEVAALEATSFTNPWSGELLGQQLGESAVTRLYVLRIPDRAVAAFCLCWVIADELHINTIAVDPAVRRRGLASELMRHVITDAAQAGASRATLEVRCSNAPAIALYERLGFSVCAVRPGYYTRPDEDALILWRDRLSGGAVNP